MSITYSECAFVFLGNQREVRMRYFVICVLSDFKIFIHIIS